jgi:nitrogenase-stabilizing/protective protein
MITLPRDLEQLDTAEAFLEHFAIAYDEAVVRRSRLHILQRFHDYLAAAELPAGDSAAEVAAMRDCLVRAYDDFVRSDPLTERVFKVLKEAPAQVAARQAAGRTFVPLDAIRGRPADED